MAERKFGGLAALQQQQAQKEEPGTDRPAALVTRPRRTGKRSDPDWKSYTILLRKANRETALQHLKTQYEDADLSDLMDFLLGQWNQAQGG